MASFQADNFTLNDVLRELDQANLKYKVGSKYVLTQCPFHEEAHPSAQIFLDDFFVLCHAQCGRQHITKAFPRLRPSSSGDRPQVQEIQRKEKQVTERVYKTFDQMEYWKSLPLIPRDHNFKFLPLEVLDDLGWRWIESKQSYYIPYFNRPKTKIPFSQMRHLQGERRFTFLKDAKPTLYGTWNLIENMGKIFLVEGTSDMAVLETCGIPCIAAPSAASSALVGSMVIWAHKHGIQPVYAGDNDEAGNKLLEAVENADIPYRRKQARHPYKDWGEMYEAEGHDSVVEYCMKELDPTWAPPKRKGFREGMTDEEKILDIFPGSTILQIRR